VKANIIIKSLLIYLITTIIFSISIIFLIPFLKENGFNQAKAYFLSAGFVLFCLLILSVILFKIETKTMSLKEFFKRFRLNKISKNDLIIIIIGIISILILDGILFGLNVFINQIFGINLTFSSLPDFTGINKIIKGDYGIIIVYFIYLFFNIFGEEFLWRGYLLPIQENVFNKFAWIFNSIFWLLFHFIFGISIIMMLPLLFILPFLVQRQKNTWVGIVIHSTTGLIGFVSIINGIL